MAARQACSGTVTPSYATPGRACDPLYTTSAGVTILPKVHGEGALRQSEGPEQPLDIVADLIRGQVRLGEDTAAIIPRYAKIGGLPREILVAFRAYEIRIARQPVEECGL